MRTLNEIQAAQKQLDEDVAELTVGVDLGDGRGRSRKVKIDASRWELVLTELCGEDGERVEVARLSMTEASDLHRFLDPLLRLPREAVPFVLRSWSTELPNDLLSGDLQLSFKSKETETGFNGSSVIIGRGFNVGDSTNLRQLTGGTIDATATIRKCEVTSEAGCDAVTSVVWWTVAAGEVVGVDLEKWRIRQ